MNHIFTLKCSTPIYAVQFLNTFCHFANLIVAKFYDQMLFLMPAGMMMRPSIFIEAPSLDDCQPNLKSDSPASETETASCQAPNWYFKVSGIIKTQILFNPLVIKIQILFLDRLNSLNAIVVFIYVGSFPCVTVGGSISSLFGIKNLLNWIIKGEWPKTTYLIKKSE